VNKNYRHLALLMGAESHGFSLSGFLIIIASSPQSYLRKNHDPEGPGLASFSCSGFVWVQFGNHDWVQGGDFPRMVLTRYVTGSGQIGVWT